jgi:O-methyltransferase
MLQVVKRIIRSVLHRRGYVLVPVPASGLSEQHHQRALANLTLSHAMRGIHGHDAVEIEELYRKFVFPDLPLNKGRASLLYDLIGTTTGEGIYVVQNLHRGLQVPGDVCEFGVAQGATSRLIANEIMANDRKLWLFDSFEGLPEPSPEDKLIDDIFNLGSMSRYKGTMASPETEVLSKLDAMKFPRARTKIKKGWIKDTVKSTDLPIHVAFAYIDFDFYEPIRDALDFLDSRMPAGGQIVVDDYGFFSEGVQLAVDQFVARTAGRYQFELPLPFSGHFCILSKVA